MKESIRSGTAAGTREVKGPMPTKTSARANPEQRERLLEACLDLVVRHGPKGFNVQALAQKSGVSASTIFRLFKGVDPVLEEFWPWCWTRLNSYLADRMYTNPRVADSYATLIQEFDYIWDLRDDERMKHVAFLCFLYYRRGNELGQASLGSEQQKFEDRVEALCRNAVTETGAAVSVQVLQVAVMSWCASVLMSWQYLPDSSQDFTPSHARLGLSNLVSEFISTKPDVAA